ncbi:hypothetical protein OCU04_001989 [Sclerotinia nivalis]|uniref:Uncharacterized protein n=1 Tax=Sclerotinia nivalis TaxID=352851 RepID=A0A9X0DR45_9HELO|nr:hypothetical protein OCU04_001989 [Sclerotinia nivalis]
MHHHIGNLELAEKYIRDCIKNAEQYGWNREPLSRARLHLARILREVDETGFSDDIRRHEKDARSALEEFLKLERPDYLKGDKDELAIFDNFQGVWNARFTGRLLLRDIQDHHGIVSAT